MKTYILLDKNNNPIGKEILPNGFLPSGNFRELKEGEDIEQLLLSLGLKQKARNKIRNIKDIEDDLTDLKKVVQFMARGFAGLWVSLPQELKDANPYKDNFDLFSNAVLNTELRLDLELDQVAKIAKILQDEAEFATIVKDEYLSKV
jgi:hypothetical protein